MSEVEHDAVAAALEQAREQERILLHAAETLTRLGRLDEFSFLLGEIEKKRVRMADSLAARLMSGEDVTVLQRQIDYDRGFITGMLYPFEVVKGATERLKSFDEQNKEPEADMTDEWSRYE